MAVHQAVLDNNLDKLETLIEVNSDKCTRATNEGYPKVPEDLTRFNKNREGPF